MPHTEATISRDGRTEVIVAGATAGTNDMVKVADALATPVGKLSTSGISATLTGHSALWSNFNNSNRSVMMRSEMLSWPVTMMSLLITFGGLVAAGLPLLLTMVGLLVATGSLVLKTFRYYTNSHARHGKLFA